MSEVKVLPEDVYDGVDIGTPHPVIGDTHARYDRNLHGERLKQLNKSLAIKLISGFFKSCWTESDSVKLWSSDICS